MCGIVGIIGKDAVAARLLAGLRRLEYRGYDSAGIATLAENGATARIERRRAAGKIGQLDALLAAEPLAGRIGIGHTRWATHGAPTVANAHPHATERVVIVHNGIIENYRELKAELIARGRRFESETDTEVVAQLITWYLDQGLSAEDAMAKTMPRLTGAFAFAVLFADRADIMIGARRDSPLAVGYGAGEMYLGSDAMALAPMTRRIAYLEDGDWVVLTRDGAVIRDQAGQVVQRAVKTTEVSGALVGKGNYRHFMEKEIYEQPEVVGYTLMSLVDAESRTLKLPKLPFDPNELARVTIVACGTSFHAALIAKYWIEQIARLPVEVDIASEFRYRAAAMPRGGLAMFVSQSGETLDTLAALRYARGQGQHILSVVNVPESTMARESDLVLRTLAGPEIGVASTKAFTTQLVVLACFALGLARARGTIERAREAGLIDALIHVPTAISAVLHERAQFRAISQGLAEARDVLYLGRGTSYPIALEGALKLKELSYIHAEGYAAGEMKHGPIALIDESVPVIVIAPPDDLFEKTASNVQEVIARGGRVILFSDAAGIRRLSGARLSAVAVPAVDPFVAPIVYAVPVQLLSYHTADIKGTDVDQPRNLAKSVTVE
jgi:glucosamine--fructose-6-phosphate aminotransferase (isomerizing)